MLIKKWMQTQMNQKQMLLIYSSSYHQFLSFWIFSSSSSYWIFSSIRIRDFEFCIRFLIKDASEMTLWDWIFTLEMIFWIESSTWSSISSFEFSNQSEHLNIQIRLEILHCNIIYMQNRALEFSHSIRDPAFPNQISNFELSHNKFRIFSSNASNLFIGFKQIRAFESYHQFSTDSSQR